MEPTENLELEQVEVENGMSFVEIVPDYWL